jgi:dipeptidyl aminopeptidase/acylaminoacyl peptidase
MLVGINADDRRYHDVYRLDLLGGTIEKQVPNPGFDEWIVDLDLDVRGGSRMTEEGAIETLVGRGDPTGWPVVLTVGADDATLHNTLGFDAKGEKLLLLTPMDWNTCRLVRFDPVTKTSEVVAQDADNDIVNVTIHPETREPQVAYVGRDRVEIIVLDPAIAADIELIKAADGGDMFVGNRDHADQRWIVGYDHDNGPVSFYMYDRGAKSQRFLFNHRSDLDEFELARMEPFSFTASDGLVIHGYATFPPGVARQSLPTVVDVHGGPWGARHSWGFDPTPQWLANRGYLCLEFNYRGSGGYGKDFLNASAQEWAGKMHTDLIEGTEWAIAQGWVDRERVAIFGGSYGGYAALVGATFTPDFFACAVDIVGPSNLITLLETIPPYWVGARQMFYRLLGHPERDRDFLWSRSPLSRVDQIRIPILIGQGANDPRVNQAESEQIVDAMKARGIDYEYLLYPDEGHGFMRPENRLNFYQAAEDFLAKHLHPSP